MQAAFADRPWFKHYPNDVRHSIEYPKEPLYSLLVDSAEKYPNRTALSYHGRKISYRELNELSNRFANGLISLGISKGSKVALVLPNLPQFVFGFYGILKSGAVAVPCNPLYREGELEFQLADSEAEAIVILDNVVVAAAGKDTNRKTDFFAEFQKCRTRLSGGKLKHVFTTSVTDFLPPIKKQLAGPIKKIKKVRREGTIDLVRFIGSQSKSEPNNESLNRKIDPLNDLAVIQYTGGTTGISKGAMLTHYNLISNAIASAEWVSTSSSYETLLAVIPFFHIYGLTNAMNGSIYLGQKIVILPSFNPKEVLKTIQKEKVTLFPGVSTMYVALLHQPDLANYSIGTIKRCISGAASLPLEVQRKFNEITGGNLVEGYGLTEASPVTHCNILRPGAIIKPGSIGVPYPDTDAKIVDLETGLKDLPVGEVGELAVRGPQVMKGYWKNQEETRGAFRGEWLLTGDIAKEDEDGFFYIVDRKKDQINTSGFKVWPREVEEVLYVHPDIKEAAVIGIPDEYRGESVKAFIVLKDKSKNLGQEQIRSFCKERIAPYKVPRVVEFVDDLPKSLVGKVLRRKLKEKEQLQKS